MYELDERWMAYFNMMEPKDRREVLTALMKEYPTDYYFAEDIFKLRHNAVKGRSGVDYPDLFLYECITLILLNKGGRFSVKGNVKELKKTCKSLGLDMAKTDLEKSLLYWEYRNAIRRYFSTTIGNGYRRKLFGLINSSAKEKEYQRLVDAWKISDAVAIKYGMEEEMFLWTEAVKEEYGALEGCSRQEIDDMTKERGVVPLV